MSDYIAEKHFCLCRAFPQYAPDMINVMRRFEAVYNQRVLCIRDLQDYIIDFAVYSKTQIGVNALPDIDKRINELINQGRVLTANALEKKYNIKNAKFLLGEYMSALRISTGADTKIYLTRSKESDFLAWIQKQLEAFEKQPHVDYKRYLQYLKAVNGMSVKPIVTQPIVKKSRTQPDVWMIPDTQMHEVACKMARKRRIKDPNEVLNDLVVKTVRKNMAKQI